MLLGLDFIRTSSCAASFCHTLSPPPPPALLVADFDKVLFWLLCLLVTLALAGEEVSIYLSIYIIQIQFIYIYFYTYAGLESTNALKSVETARHHPSTCSFALKERKKIKRGKPTSRLKDRQKIHKACDCCGCYRVTVVLSVLSLWLYESCLLYV